VTAIPDSSASRALILAPQGRDAAVAVALLKEASIASVVCADLAAFQQALGDEASFAVVTEDALQAAGCCGIAAWVEAQPSWSDLPFIILTQRGGGPERNPGAARLSEVLGNVTFLERPFHPTTFVSVARAALKWRYRQYEARTRMEELHEGEERLRTALRAGRLGSWELDIASRKLTASAAFKLFFGRGADEPIDYEDVLHTIHPDDRARVQAALRSSIETGTDYEIEHRNVWPDGSIHWIEARARITRNGRGNRTRLVGVCSDITVRKAAEQELRRLNETLEERVGERTAELEQAHKIVLDEIAQRERAEEQLRQAQKMEMIGQLTGGVAHDFNNLLMAVIGNLDLLRKHIPRDSRSTRLIESALLGARRGAELTQRLLAFARRQDLKIAPTNIIDLVNGMSDLLERSVGSQTEVRIVLPQAVPLALVDPNQLELALLNLVVNARDAMPGGGTLTIEVDVAEAAAGCELAPGRYLCVTVSDTGEGMDTETLARATEPFFSTKEVGKGTGLGLSTIHGLVVQLHGALRLSSEVGRGTRAELWLPVTTAPAATVKAPAPAAEIEHAIPPKATILLVDDDALIAMSTAAMLEDLGHEVIEADSGESALEMLRRHHGTVDLMITDYSMPKMTGAQLAEAARELQPRLPILLATGYAELPPGSACDLPRLGKPYRQADLAAEIAKVLKPGAAA